MHRSEVGTSENKSNFSDHNSVVIKEALWFYKFEPFLYYDDNITKNEDININDSNGSYISNIYITNTECYAN